MVYGVWCMVYGVWCMVYGAWLRVKGRVEGARQHVAELLGERVIEEQLLYRNVQWFQGGLVFKAHRLVCHQIAVKKMAAPAACDGTPW